MEKKKATRLVEDFFNQFNRPFALYEPAISPMDLFIRLRLFMMGKLSESLIYEHANYQHSDVKIKKLKNTFKKLSIPIDGKGLNEILSHFQVDYHTIKKIYVVYDELNEAFNNYLNEKITEASSRIDTFKSLSKQKKYRAFHPLRQTIDSLKDDLKAYNACLNPKISTRNIKKPELYPAFDKQLTIAGHKQYFWKDPIHKTVETINRYCHHKDNCEKSCKTIHKKSLHATAYVLAILYPSVWTQDQDIDGVQYVVKQIYYSKK